MGGSGNRGRDQRELVEQPASGSPPLWVWHRLAITTAARANTSTPAAAAIQRQPITTPRRGGTGSITAELAPERLRDGLYQNNSRDSLVRWWPVPNPCRRDLLNCTAPDDLQSATKRVVIEFIEHY